VQEAVGGHQQLVTLFQGSSGLTGAVIVDVAAAVLRVSQWQETDTRCSLLRLLLVQTNAAEVVVLHGNLTADATKALKAHKPLCIDGIER
jgi:hypothetical protein